MKNNCFQDSILNMISQIAVEMETVKRNIRQTNDTVVAVDNTATMAAELNMLIALVDSASEKLKSYRNEIETLDFKVKGLVKEKKNE